MGTFKYKYNQNTRANIENNTGGAEGEVRLGRHARYDHHWVIVIILQGNEETSVAHRSIIFLVLPCWFKAMLPGNYYSPTLAFRKAGIIWGSTPTHTLGIHQWS